MNIPKLPDAIVDRMNRSFPRGDVAAPPKETPTESDVCHLNNGIDLVTLVNGKIPPQYPTFQELPPELSKGKVFTSTHDAVSRPDHYHFSDFEPIKVIQAWDLSFALGNVVKYIARAGRKDSSKLIEDLEKAKRYLELELEHLRKG